ncbi:sensor histidine kinase [Segetibacter koreensis]|uniref:sensor histidine kinase n=1 Tax=Segetibacter koreensis TaxID=398037 RepID=UPI0012FCF48C|nr:response regulator [Segetibacter koreensis]
MELTKETPFRQSDVRILVVDDREDNLFSIETILEKDGYTLVKANSGRAALKILLHQHDFTLILMDVQMPGMNGLETATLISEREKLKHIPIIFITAHNYEEEYIFKGYQMGGVDYIYKPINPELLRVKVGVFVELYRRNHKLLEQEKKLLSANKSLEKEIEERKISEEKIRVLNLQLIENNAHLQSTNQELDRFAYVASHDLQEPLRKIQLFTDKLIYQMSERLDDEVKLYLQKIGSASKRMQQLVNDLLKFSRQTSEDTDFEQTNLSDVLNDVLSDMETDIQKKNVKIVADNLPVIYAIPSQIRQLFQNLISNSIKFSKPDNTPEINIQAEVTKGAMIPEIDRKLFEQNFYKIYIRDNGIGFDSKYAEEIFVVFKRLHTYHQFEGTGIGLSICKKIVEKHNGFITAQSNLNEGSTFIITLPAETSEA